MSEIIFIMKFNNKPNKPHNINGKIIWESRSVAVNCVIMIKRKNNDIPDILVSKRGPNAADYQGLYNVVAGYLDYNETGTEAVFRETWEECGLRLEDLVNDNDILSVDLINPWFVNTRPTENKQNVSLRYGVYLKLDTEDYPDLSLENNEVIGEVSEAWWIPIDQVDDLDWAFNHDILIKDYIDKIGDEKLIKYIQ